MLHWIVPSTSIMFNSHVLIGLGILTYLGLMLPGLNTPCFGAWFCALILDS